MTAVHRPTQFERTRLIGVRAEQINNGAKIFTDLNIYGKNTKGKTVVVNILSDALDIAEKEYNEGVIPLSIIRRLPGGKVLKISFRPVKSV
jgi:DNA-directed RNA polymerase subunit K/omega